jgi:hypothetical protein
VAESASVSQLHTPQQPRDARQNSRAARRHRTAAWRGRSRCGWAASIVDRRRTGCTPERHERSRAPQMGLTEHAGGQTEKPTKKVFRSQESEFRSQNSGVRIQESEFRSQNSGVRRRKGERYKGQGGRNTLHPGFLGYLTPLWHPGWQT